MTVKRISRDPAPVAPLSDDVLVAELIMQLDELGWLLLAAPDERKRQVDVLCEDVTDLIVALGGSA